MCSCLEYLGPVKKAVFAISAGRAGNYKEYSWALCWGGSLTLCTGAHLFLDELSLFERALEFKC